MNLPGVVFHVLRHRRLDDRHGQIRDSAPFGALPNDLFPPEQSQTGDSLFDDSVRAFYHSLVFTFGQQIDIESLKDQDVIDVVMEEFRKFSPNGARARRACAGVGDRLRRTRVVVRDRGPKRRDAVEIARLGRPDRTAWRKPR